RSRRAYKLARHTTGSRRLARALAPKPSTITLERDYELFYPVFNHVHELYALSVVPHWRQRCRRAACFINEAWGHLPPRYLLELLPPFDPAFLGCAQMVDVMARLIGRPCSYLPLAADVLRFSPPLERAPRFIDVCNIGRRSPVTHQALLDLARERGLFYFYDTVAARGPRGELRT